MVLDPRECSKLKRGATLVEKMKKRYASAQVTWHVTPTKKIIAKTSFIA